MPLEGLTTIVKTAASGATQLIPVVPGTQDGELNTYFDTKFMDLREFAGPDVDPSRVKKISGISLEMEETQPEYLIMYLGTKENINDTPVWNGPYYVNVGKIQPLNLKARFIALRVADLYAQVIWQMTAINIHGKWTRAGRRR